MSRRIRKVVVEQSSGARAVEQGRLRLLCVGLFFVLCFGSISVRLFEVAVLRKPGSAMIVVSDIDESGVKNELVDVKNGSSGFQRGNIVDRNGVLIATSLATSSVFANPREIRDPQDVARRLQKALGMDGKTALARLKSGRSFVWIKRHLTPVEEQAVNSLGIPGLYFLPDERRVYPYGSMLAHVLGYVGIDNKGLAAIEKSFDVRLRDPGENRDPLALSIDVRLQAVLREEMKKAVEDYRAIGATGAIMDIRSGELLAMVSLPDFDPHNPGKASDIARFNRASLGSYEMGSTFKSFTVAMALDAGVASMKSGYDASRPFKLASFTITDTHPKGRWLSVPEIYAYSSNIGTAKMALDCGTKRQKAFLEKLGMFKPVEIELPEKAVPLYPADWKEINTVTISYGHGISVSPLHLLRGIAGLVGDGALPRLTLIKDGNQNRPREKRVVSQDTSRNIRRLMRLVVDHGTGSKADVPGYRVGGKTGTAEKVQAGGAYNKDAKLASFIGAFPIDDPRYIVLVMVDEPKGDKSTYGFATGGWISAPVAERVIARMGPMVGLMPQFDVPADDAERFWTDNGKPRTRQAVSQAAPLNRRYVHAISY